MLHPLHLNFRPLVFIIVYAHYNGFKNAFYRSYSILQKVLLLVVAFLP
jgi:hypothetical protein